MKHKIYCYAVDVGRHWGLSVYALGDDGASLSQHLSSDKTWAQHDIGMTSNWKHDEYNNHFGENQWELEWIEYEDLDDHEGFQAAWALNQQAAKNEVQS